jgi:hypothetical protein
VGNNVVFGVTSLYDQALKGGDYEFGAPIPGLPFVRGYLGGYAYSATGPDPIGFRGRLEAYMNNAVQLQFAAAHDRVYGTTLTMAVDIRLNGSKPTAPFCPLTPEQRMYLPVQRNYRIATTTVRRTQNVLGINPRTGLPENIVFVDDTNTNPGDGTFENPFRELPNAAPGSDIVFVYTGNSDAANPYAGPIVLADNQRLLGEGLRHVFDVQVSQFGRQTTRTVQLPGATNGIFPTITNPTGSAVVLANNNEVSGFNLLNNGGSGITGTGVTDFNLNNLVIQNSQAGINLANASGTGLLDRITLTNNTAGGVLIDSGAAPLNLRANSIVSSLGGVGMLLVADDSAISAAMTNVLATENNTGLVFGASG